MGKGLDINVLRTFQAVARLGRFNAAADYVHRSPSAVTTQIQKLEEQVGQQLFARSNQAVALTPAGRHLLGEATRFLIAHDKLLATLSPRQLTGKVRLGVPDGYAATLMSECLPVFVASNPKMELEAVACSSAQLLDLFARQQLDLAVAVSSEQIQQGDWLRSTELRWAAAKGFIRDDSRPLPLALQLKDCPYREAALQALKAKGIAPMQSRTVSCWKVPTGMRYWPASKVAWQLASSRRSKPTTRSSFCKTRICRRFPRTASTC